MKSAFAACLMAAAVMGATSVKKDEYSFEKDAPMGATTGAAGFGEAVKSIKYTAVAEQFDDHTVTITTNYFVTLNADWAP